MTNVAAERLRRALAEIDNWEPEPDSEWEAIEVEYTEEEDE